MAEKEAIKLELEESSNKLKECMLNTNETMTKEIKSLKQMIKNIEEDSLKEKTAFQKQLHKRIKENNQLIEEINEIRANERSLKHQINSLQTELSVYRRKYCKFNHSFIFLFNLIFLLQVVFSIIQQQVTMVLIQLCVKYAHENHHERAA